jgi:hypothetical protein
VWSTAKETTAIPADKDLEGEVARLSAGRSLVALAVVGLVVALAGLPVAVALGVAPAGAVTAALAAGGGLAAVVGGLKVAALAWGLASRGSDSELRALVPVVE